MKTLVLAAAILSLAGATSATAETVTTTVATSQRGLDLSRPADARIMLGRLDRAALAACGASQFSLPDVKVGTRRTACYGDAMSQAVASLNAPALSAAYAARGEVRLASN